MGRLGTYELVRPLARGGMADIYLARKAGIGRFERLVAIKILNETRTDDAESRQMFLDEARLVGMLHHQNIAGVLEVDVVDGQHYLAMEYVDGADLRELLSAASRQRAVVPLETALAIVVAAAAGLDHAHRRTGPDGQPLRLVHRDVSLSNIMVGHDGGVKVVDFGIAQTTIGSVHTNPGVVRGKASYMSPEQCRGDAVDYRSDLFALGVVLYELTTGARCFHGKTDFDRMLAVVRGEYIAPAELVADYPPELGAVVGKLLALEPTKRFSSAAALIDELEQLAVARGWVLGPATIQRTMKALFASDEVVTGHVTAAPPADDAPATEPHPVVYSATPPQLPTAPLRRMARGTETEWSLDDDERTRGRRAIAQRSIALGPNWP